MADGAQFQRVFTGWRGAALAIFAALQVLACLALFPDQARSLGAFGAETSSTRGFFAVPVPDRPGWIKVTSALPTSGAQVGDLVKFDNTWETRAIRPTGHKTWVTIEREGRAYHTQIANVQRNFEGEYALGSFSNLVDFGVSLFSLFLGILLVWRGWRQLSAVLLGISLVALALPLDVPSFIETRAGAAAFWIISPILNLPFAAAFAFPAALYVEAGGRISKSWKWPAIAIIVMSVIDLAAIAWFNFYAAFPFGITNNATFELATLAFAACCAGYWTWRGYVGTTGNGRRRFAILFAGYVAVLLSLAVRYAGEGTVTWAGRIPYFIANSLLFTTFLCLLTYAVLRHKVVDLGFALNRTVVYGTVSAILLASFGLAEWAFHHLLPEEWSKASAWADAGIALGLYLTFHRLRDFVEHHLERLFFHSWQENEAKLRRFVTAASHFESREALAEAFAAELARFSGAPVALYLRGERGLVHAAGGWAQTPALFPADDSAFALMRAERRPLDLTETRTDLPGVLALPMLDHGALAGFAVLDSKAGGTLYRPDEIETLGWAAHQVGLDLAALHGRKVEEENRRLAAQVEKLSDLIGTRLAPA